MLEDTRSKILKTNAVKVVYPLLDDSFYDGPQPKDDSSSDDDDNGSDNEELKIKTQAQGQGQGKQGKQG